MFNYSGPVPARRPEAVYAPSNRWWWGTPLTLLICDERWVGGSGGEVLSTLEIAHCAPVSWKGDSLPRGSTVRPVEKLFFVSNGSVRVHHWFGGRGREDLTEPKPAYNQTSTLVKCEAPANGKSVKTLPRVGVRTQLTVSRSPSSLARGPLRQTVSGGSRV
ncbi:transcriptional regulator [Anopheles sinensis]|uniref:Transcriptional regulator n=1 Tax=Anopheles sinensis TaxID=74873 RepID=A0A084WRE5_ANOSI|nr:transcriptional regulator [Anopheles sinensis]